MIVQSTFIWANYLLPNSPYCTIYLWWETERENWSWSLLGVKGLTNSFHHFTLENAFTKKFRYFSRHFRPLSLSVCLLNQSASKEHNQERKKKAHIPLRTSWISPKLSAMFDIMQSYYCEYKIRSHGSIQQQQYRFSRLRQPPSTHLFNAASTIRIQKGSNKVLIPNAIMKREKMFGNMPKSRCIAQHQMMAIQKMMILANGPMITMVIASRLRRRLLW